MVINQSIDRTIDEPELVAMSDFYDRLISTEVGPAASGLRAAPLQFIRNCFLNALKTRDKSKEC